MSAFAGHAGCQTRDTKPEVDTTTVGATLVLLPVTGHHHKLKNGIHVTVRCAILNHRGGEPPGVPKRDRHIYICTPVRGWINSAACRLETACLGFCYSKSMPIRALSEILRPRDY